MLLLKSHIQNFMKQQDGEESGLLIAKWKDGHIIDEEDGRFNLYFKDGDGNLLEIIAHSYVKEDVLVPQSPLNILYVREIGLPVKSVPILGMAEIKSKYENDGRRGYF